MFFNWLGEEKVSLQLYGNTNVKKEGRINSKQSSLKSHSLLLTLYRVTTKGRDFRYFIYYSTYLKSIKFITIELHCPSTLHMFLTYFQTLHLAFTFKYYLVQNFSDCQTFRSQNLSVVNLRIKDQVTLDILRSRLNRVFQ